MKIERFQSLIGRLVTSSPCRSHSYAQRFQSLIGRLVTCARCRKHKSNSCFNPLYVGLLQRFFVSLLEY